jgi:hypothetical protein
VLRSPQQKKTSNGKLPKDLLGLSLVQAEQKKIIQTMAGKNGSWPAKNVSWPAKMGVGRQKWELTGKLVRFR